MSKARRLLDTATLSGINVLVVEDDYFIATEMCRTLQHYEAFIVGPASNLERALELLDTEAVDCAVLDINLHGEMGFLLAEEAERRGVPLIFATGYDEGFIPDALAGKVRLEKPVDLGALLRAVLAATDRPPMPVSHQ